VARDCGGRVPHPAWGAAAARQRADRRYRTYPQAGRAVHRAPDRAGAHLCRSGGHRDGECAAARRIAGAHARPRRIARIPDRDQRRAQRHQPLDRRRSTGARHRGRNGRPALRQRFRSDHDTRGRGLPLCVEQPGGCSGSRVVGGLAPANHSPRSRQHRRAGGARTQGRAYRRHPRRPGLRGAGGCGGWATHQPRGAAAARGGGARRDQSRAAAGGAVQNLFALSPTRR
jgi:hypothetical protein